MPTKHPTWLLLLKLPLKKHEREVDDVEEPEVRPAKCTGYDQGAVGLG